MSVLGEIGRATRKGFKRMIAARERQARRYVNATLLQFDDETLARAGYNRRALEQDGATWSPF
jgi:hypothetical protein